MFKIELEDIGSLKKIRVTIDGKGERKEWFLDRIEMTNLKTNKVYMFACNQLISKNKGTKSLTVDIPLVTKSGKEAIEKTSYKITGKLSKCSKKH